MKTAYMLEIPSFLGSRARSAELANTVPTSAEAVVLNFSLTLSAAQGACDELVRDLGQLRGLEMTILSSSEKTASLIRNAAELRQVSSLLLFINPERTEV